MREIKKIIVHCSDSTFGSEKLIDEWHKDRGWRGCGYHFVILNGQVDKDTMIQSLDGAICPSRSVKRIGAHVQGHNKDSIGICLIGKALFTKAQYLSLNRLICELGERYNTHTLSVLAHYQLDKKKTCPNFNLNSVLKYNF